MRALLDQGLPATAVEAFRELGWDVIHVREIGMSAAPDSEILRRAADERRVVVTVKAKTRRSGVHR